MKFLDRLKQTSSYVSDRIFRIPTETKGWEELKAGITTVSSGGSGNLTPTVRTEQTIKKYRSWVYPCVNLITRKVTSVDYYLYKEQSKKSKEQYERIFGHPAIKLLEHPNGFLSGRQLKETIQLHLDLCGFSCVKIVRNGAGQPKELHPMLPHELVDIELGTHTDNIIKAFHFAPLQSRHNREVIPYRDILYFHYPNPANIYLPISPIQALAHVTDLDLYLQVYEKDFFHNGARPDFLIVPEKHLSPAQAERVSEGWAAKHRGPGKQFRPAVLSDNVKIQQVTMSASDFQFMGLSSWIQDHILAAYNVPKEMLGLQGEGGKAASINVETVFVNNCISRRLELFEDVINHQLLPQYRNTDGLIFEHASALPKDDEWQLAKDQGELNSGLITINEVRRREGKAPFVDENGKPAVLCEVPWMGGRPIPGILKKADEIWNNATMPPPPAMPGQDPMAQLGMGGESNLPQLQGVHGIEGGRPENDQVPLQTQVSEILQNSRPSLSALLSASRGKRGGLAALISNHADAGSLGRLLSADRRDPGLTKLFTKAIRDHLLEWHSDNPNDKIFLDATEDMITKSIEMEEDFEKECEKFYKARGEEIAYVIKGLYGTVITKGSDIDINEDDLRQHYMEQASPYIIKATNLGFNTGYRLVQKAGGNVGEPDVFEKASLEKAGIFLNYSSDLKVKSTKKALIGIIKEGLEKGLGSDEVAEMIQKRFEDIGASRANLIARTEISGAVNAGIDASYEDINNKAGKIIVKSSNVHASLDERLCPECRAKDGQIVKDYITGKEYLKLPLHPNCRCGQIPKLA
jgi:HK97 family phage portal protein